MGYTRYDAGDWGSYAASTSTKTHRDYGATSLAAELDPTKFGFRESVASKANPNPTPIVLGLDITGSMGRTAEAMRKGLGTTFQEILARSAAGTLVSDPSLMACAIGDMDAHDRAPIQATQFENDPVTLGKQVESFFMEGGGGGNHYESYLGPWYLAAMRTKCDAFAGSKPRKGFIFTMGDEEPQMVLRAAAVKRFFGDAIERDLTAQELLAITRRNFEVFHLMVEEGSHFRSYGPEVMEKWRALLGQNALRLSDHTKAAEVIVSAIEAVAGRDADAIVKSWSGSTALVVKHAIGGLTRRGASGALEGPRRL